MSMSPGMFNKMYFAGRKKTDSQEDNNTSSSISNLDLDKLCKSLDKVADGLNNLADSLDRMSSSGGKVEFLPDTKK